MVGMIFLPKLFLLAFVPTLVHSLASTDEIQDADPSQSGYLDNHNMHPATVGSPIFGFLWKNSYGSKEKWYAKPLVYTPTGGSQKQLVFLASSMNVIRTVDAVTGAAINTRTVQAPFLQSDIGCTDIPDYIGIIGTPIIDPTTDTVYFFSKGYKGGASFGGVANGIYNFYAVDINTLADKPGYPVLIDGHNADNDPTRYFIGGTVLQRPSLTMLNGVVIGGFGGHCDLFNYTGLIVGVSTTEGVGVTSIYAMEGGPGTTPVVSDITVQSGGKAGIWAGGMGIASDLSRIFFATGNGQGHANGQTPASGRSPLSTLDEVVANFGVSAGGKFSLTDYFEPFEYEALDAGDRDVGSGGVALLDPTVFKGVGVSRIAVTVGKNGKAYIMNANNLGGFKQGSGGVDNILQTIIADGAVFGGAGSYPLEGGFIYFTPVGFPTSAYRLGFDSSGKIAFTKSGATAKNSAGRVGMGIPTITTYKGLAGTAILWICDVDSGLQAFSAVPDNNGILQPIATFATGGLNKFQRPAFGDSRLYVSDVNGNVMCLGSPVALPLQCSQPVDFGSVSTGTKSTQLINCTSLIRITSINGCSTADSTFHCINSTLPQGPLAQGATFSFPVTWDLTQASINDAQNASFGKVLPGVKGTSLNIYTTNGVPKYSSQLPISLQGNTISESAFLNLAPLELDFGGLVTGSGTPSTSTLNVIVSNLGAITLTFTGVAWGVTGGDSINYQNITTTADRTKIISPVFSSKLLPSTGNTIAPGASISVPITFTTNSIGQYQGTLQFWTTGGTGYVVLAGSGSTSPIANLSVSTVEGGWDYSNPVVVDFGNVPAGTSQVLSLRMCNFGGSALEITKSKPPIQSELTAANPLTDLHEGQFIDVNTCALAEVDVIAAPLGINRPVHVVSGVWILNANDPNFGVHDVNIAANIVTSQIGPLMPDGTARYLYLGCYYDGSGRQLQTQYNNATGNENGWCQATCLSKNYKFSGTEYHSECWCGNNPPSASKYTFESAKACTYSCPADSTQACGGVGTYISVYYDRTRYTPDTGSIPLSSSISIASTSNAPSKVSISSSSASSFPLTVSNSASLLTTSSSVTLTHASPTSVPPTISSNIPTTTSPASPVRTSLGIVSSVGAFNYVGCYAEPPNARALTGLLYANDTMTVELCAATCSGFIWMGIEYSRECWCGNSINNGTALASTGCNMVCKGDAFEYCGGSNRLQMYNKLSMSAVSSTTTSFITTMSSTSSIYSSSSSKAAATSSAMIHASTTTAALPVAAGASSSVMPTPSAAGTTAGISGFFAQGCFSDPAGGPFSNHNMPLVYANDSMTIESCIAVAKARLSAIPATTYLYIGLEYGRECYAHTAAPTPEPTKLLGSKACTFPCKGNTSERCGAGNMYNLWASGTSISGTVTGTAIWSSVPAMSTKL